MDFGAARDGVTAANRGRRIVVDYKGKETEDVPSDSNGLEPEAAPA